MMNSKIITVRIDTAAEERIFLNLADEMGWPMFCCRRPAVEHTGFFKLMPQGERPLVAVIIQHKEGAREGAVVRFTQGGGIIGARLIRVMELQQHIFNGTPIPGLLLDFGQEDLEDEGFGRMMQVLDAATEAQADGDWLRTLHAYTHAFPPRRVIRFLVEDLGIDERSLFVGVALMQSWNTMQREAQVRSAAERATGIIGELPGEVEVMRAMFRSGMRGKGEA